MKIEYLNINLDIINDNENDNENKNKSHNWLIFEQLFALEVPETLKKHRDCGLLNVDWIALDIEQRKFADYCRSRF